MDCRDRATLDKMPNLHKSGLNIETGLGIDIRKPKFGGVGRKPEKEWDTNTIVILLQMKYLQKI